MGQRTDIDMHAGTAVAVSPAIGHRLADHVLTWPHPRDEHLHLERVQSRRFALCFHAHLQRISTRTKRLAP